MKKSYLKIEIGSRGEIEDVDLVMESVESLREELEKWLDSCDSEGDKEFWEVNEDRERGVVEFSRGEEEVWLYIEEGRYVEMVEEIEDLWSGDELEIDVLSDILDEKGLGGYV